MSDRYEIYASSFPLDLSIETPVEVTDSFDYAIEEAFLYFDQEGWYSVVVDTEWGEAIYVDYYFVNTLAYMND